MGRRYLYLLTGLPGETVTDVSQRLLAHHGGIANQGTVNLNRATVSGNSTPQCSNVSGC